MSNENPDNCAQQLVPKAEPGRPATREMPQLQLIKQELGAEVETRVRL